MLAADRGIAPLGPRPQLASTGRRSGKRGRTARTERTSGRMSGVEESVAREVDGGKKAARSEGWGNGGGGG